MTKTRAGIGLRTPHLNAFLQQKPALGLVEVHSENHFADGGPLRRQLHDIAAIAPLSLHGVGLSLGSADELDRAHLRRLKTVVDELNPALVSEHICWGRIGDVHSHDLLPLPYCDDTLALMVARIDQVQQCLGRELLIENISHYVIPDGSVMPEWDFVAQLLARAHCGLLLDVNNVYVNSQNFSFDPQRYFTALPWDRVREVHVAGFEREADLLIDTHSRPVCSDVQQLLSTVLPRCAPTLPIVLEWDTNLPSFDVLLAQAYTVVDAAIVDVAIADLMMKACTICRRRRSIPPIRWLCNNCCCAHPPRCVRRWCCKYWVVSRWPKLPRCKAAAKAP